MNTEINADQRLIQKGQDKKLAKPKHKKLISKKFDKIGFLVAWGIAFVFAVIGTSIIGAIKGTRELATESIAGNNTSLQLVGFFPESVKETLVFILGSIFILGAVLFIFVGLKIVAQYIAGRNRKYEMAAKKNFYKPRLRKLFPR